ncbi:hypothetical protein B0J11DRAFT_155197 [Dendryphion nanum]|uniref:Uncharacterized protein n=1 Tax=Dendryphion nanum TaxID=256645 RepID=A0A9P9EES3_9PLEO|nr:hypothetical protein B0J11DRAFT_155197 [Dendryphion nanum]
MPRSRSSFTASPSRYRSPQRSPTRALVPEEGSQYEIDLSALGHDSTFESSELGNNHAPKVDVVDTSDIDGPDDFTANLTFYMTADYPLSQIKSRKEANGKIVEAVRADMRSSTDTQDITEEGDRAVIEDNTRSKDERSHFGSQSQTVRANGTSDDDHDQHLLSELSMEHDEKVMSYLSALPDTDLQDIYTSTPLRSAKQNILQVPESSPPKVRSMQAAVEDYETPRKPTQETVIHRRQDDVVQATDLDTKELEILRSQIVELQTRLTQQETIASYTRSELENARSDNYKHRARIATLEEQQKKQEEWFSKQTLETKLKDLSEELHHQNLAKLQAQRESFEQQLQLAEEGKRQAEAHNLQTETQIAELGHELEQIRASNEDDVRIAEKKHSAEQQDLHDKWENEREMLNRKLESVQARAQELQASLVEAMTKAETARHEADSARSDAEATRREIDETLKLHSLSESVGQAHTTQIRELEARIHNVQTQLGSSRTEISEKDRQLLANMEEQERLDHRLNTAQGRIEGLESTISALRQQLADAQRDAARARTDVERYEREAEEANEELQDAKREVDRRIADADKKISKVKEQKIDLEERLRELRNEHDNITEDHESKLEDVRSRAEDAVRKAGALLETERSEKKRVAKELKSAIAQLDRLRIEAAEKAMEEEVEEADDDVSELSVHADSKAQELENLRTLLRKQAAAMKTLKSEHSSFRKQIEYSNKKVQSELSELQDENAKLKTENSKLMSTVETQRAEFEAVNQVVDERLAATVSKLMKERAKTAVSRRDDQWTQSVEQLNEEKLFRGKVLLREWGRQECGVAAGDEYQLYSYKATKRP